MSKSANSITVFFPCYNDSKSISHLVKSAFKTLKKLSKNYEVIIIDDASTDGSQEILKKLEKKYQKFRAVYHKKNMGYGGVLRDGFKLASKSLVFYTDGDGQYDPRELPLLVDLMTKDVDFVNGIKMPRKDPTHRIIIGNLYSFIVRWAFWAPIYDIDCDFRLIRKSLLKKLKLVTNSGSICIELVKKSQRQGAKFRQVSIHHYERRYGDSQFFQMKHLVSTLKEIVFLWVDLMMVDKLSGKYRPLL